MVVLFQFLDKPAGIVRRRPFRLSARVVPGKAGHRLIIKRRIVMITECGNGDPEVDAGATVRARHVSPICLGEIVLR
ncbi:hypothetical protein DC31_11385 [Microbacterium sp. CH12i]|uniref:hypothetical protein n=1 Tax=Microbacterium sp. CH12i TaxID=1479651 RepID=UPI0004614A38|nr:hypothetical protein [Microbacterium sp. CH12i]KDA06157.1 hypothetical protein DC31_11385 [Microbacterium sp. CH12i]